MIKNLRRFRSNFLNPAMESLLESQPSRKFHWVTVVWMIGLFAGGLFVFGHFFNWGNFDMLYHDWARVTGPRLEFLQKAIREGQLPLQISDAETFHFETTRYLAVADSFISPQYLLLKWLSLPVFSLVNVWLLYALGFAGLLFLWRRLHLSLISFTALFLLFNFNGNILAHYSVGHTNWGGYFLLPWFAWLVFRLLEGDHSWRWTTFMSVLLFVIWLQGSYHHYVWLLILLAAIGIFAPRTLWTVVKTGLITLLVSAFRILPCILAYTSYKQSFLNGYPSLLAIWDNLVNLPNAVSTPFYVNPNLGEGLGEWELTSFIGLIGGLFLLYFGVYRGLLHREAKHRELIVPLGGILLLSLGPVYKILLALPIPLLQGERVSARMFSLALVFGLILAAEHFQHWLNERPKKLVYLTGCAIALALTVVELWQDFLIWRVSNRDQNFWIYFNPAKWYPNNNYSDTIYIGLIVGGLAISLITILVLFGLSWREYRHTKHRPLTEAA
jgi:hypothetical protein